jgi:hypothetical protein
MSQVIETALTYAAVLRSTTLAVAAPGVRCDLQKDATERPRPVIAIAHMVPLYAVLAAPLLRPARVPIVLRLTHWDNRRVLRLAARVSIALTSVDERS